ncbi:TetR/AcrR family transcriptional regulator [Pseudoxanthomonas dokdonensis]|uniref:TetR family transcriptional regulator n=1 Tax=Pseudoxanthomonas dokdonensis TaxID=344882 RepID=A0A0R0CKZ5_9GAMM|nr:TetR/AcrR family transcriptional regulator [Pseudoxanthomonas dokdonensis]KRG70697.1 TetR family transcriptional regulator [Pseudoxanthomonas dokdonensis]
MTSPAARSSATGSSASQRADAQRGRILDAARRCFIAHGFHAAAVSEIAAEAGISQGLMYRYFDNKRAMILALIEHQLREGQDSISQGPPSLDMVDGLLACYRQWAQGQTIAGHDTAIANVTLYAEITAEAQRDPMVASVLRRHDQLTSDNVRDWLRQHDQARGRDIDEAALCQRTLLLRIVVEGLAMRAIRDPDLSADTLRAVLRQTIARVLGEDG